MDLKYTHLSRSRFASLWDRTGVYHNMKPVGLWVSDKSEEGWLAWCRSEDFGYGPYEYEVTLKKGANILFIKTLEELDEFDTMYSESLPSLAGSKRELLLELSKNLLMWINWERVIEEYDGIMIFPYQYKRRYEYMWYNAWDCASGCIFYPSRCVESIKYRGSYIDESKSKEVIRGIFDWFQQQVVRYRYWRITGRGRVASMLLKKRNNSSAKDSEFGMWLSENDYDRCTDNKNR